MINEVVNTSEKVVAFSSEEFGEVEIILIDGKEYFPAIQCAKILGYSNPRDAVLRHCKGEGVVKRDGVSLTTNQHGVTTEQVTETKYINEGNLYRLIVKSHLPAAEKFERWVFDEVLPTIRQTGGYSVISKPDSYMIENPIERAKRWIEEEQERIALREAIEQQKPMVEFAEHVTNSSDCIGMGEFAKVVHDENIKLGRNKLFEWMRDNHIFMQGQTLPYQKYIDNGWFNVVEVTKRTAYGTKVFPKTVITGIGQVNILEKLRKEFAA